MERNRESRNGEGPSTVSPHLDVGMQQGEPDERTPHNSGFRKQTPTTNFWTKIVSIGKNKKSLPKMKMNVKEGTSSPNETRPVSVWKLPWRTSPSEATSTRKARPRMLHQNSWIQLSFRKHGPEEHTETETSYPEGSNHANEGDIQECPPMQRHAIARLRDEIVEDLKLQTRKPKPSKVSHTDIKQQPPSSMAPKSPMVETKLQSKIKQSKHTGSTPRLTMNPKSNANQPREASSSTAMVEEVTQRHHAVGVPMSPQKMTLSGRRLHRTVEPTPNPSPSPGTSKRAVKRQVKARRSMEHLLLPGPPLVDGDGLVESPRRIPQKVAENAAPPLEDGAALSSVRTFVTDNTNQLSQHRKDRGLTPHPRSVEASPRRTKRTPIRRRRLLDPSIMHQSLTLLDFPQQQTKHFSGNSKYEAGHNQGMSPPSCPTSECIAVLDKKPTTKRGQTDPHRDRDSASSSRKHRSEDLAPKISKYFSGSVSVG